MKIVQMKTNSHQKLFQQFLAGNRQAFEQLYDELSPEIFRYLLLYLRQREIAEEILQTVFLAAFKKAERLAEMENPASYLMSSARNAANKYLRKVQGEQQAISYMRIFQAGLSQESGMESQFQHLFHHLECLENQDQEVILLHVFNNLSFEKMAGVLAVSPPVARYRYEKAIEKLKKRMKQ